MSWYQGELGQPTAAEWKTLSDRLGQKEHGADNCDGLGSDGQDRIQHEIEHFRGEWKTSIHNLTEDIGNWGGLSKAISDMVQQFDAGVADALQPPGGR